MITEYFLHHKGGIGAKHDHLAMGHVDNTHDAESDGKTDCRQQQHRAEAEALKQVSNQSPACDAGFNLLQRNTGRGPHGGIHLDKAVVCFDEQSADQSANIGIRESSEPLHCRLPYV